MIKPDTTRSVERSIFRWTHIVFSIPILGYIYSPFENVRLCSRYSVCLSSYDGRFGIVDVERPCRSTTYFEEVTQQNYWHDNGTKIGGIKIQ
jgi:hypothetical protein